LTDLSGKYYTLVMESSYKSLTDYEESMLNTTAEPESQERYEKFKVLVDSGKREFFTIVK